MPQQDVPRYDEQIESFMAEHPEGVTMTQISDHVGMTRSGIYSWKDRNLDRLRSVGRGRNGAEAYVLDPVGGGVVRQQTMGRALSGAFVPGSVYKVYAVQLDDDGNTVAVLRSDEGAEIMIAT